MRAPVFLALTSAAALAMAAWVGCGSSSDSSSGADTGTGGAVACPPCVTDQDCNGGVCAQVGGDTYCAPTCPNGDECVADRACVPATTVTGAQASVCLPRGDVCGVAPGDDAGVVSDTCGTLLGPNVKAGCQSCGTRPCQPNGCYGDWWCDSATNRCQAPPTTCVGAEGGAPFDGGGPVTGTVGPNGGTISRLLFGIVGDTRPASPDDTAAYPTAIIDKIYTSIEALGARPPLVVSTGDYNFASTRSAESSAQIGLYMAARAKYSGAFFPAMGNHECTGATASNCGPGNPDGITNNYTSFLTKMLAPIGKTDPYYAINVDAKDGSWKAKFVVVAANAWTPAQATWLETTLAVPTTYTFVIRHEPVDTPQAPGVTPSDLIMVQHPLTLSLVGHTHSYYHSSGREVLVGNGGAPLTGSKNYGFAIVSQRPDLALEVDMIDYASGLTDPKFHFVVKPDGSPTL